MPLQRRIPKFGFNNRFRTEYRAVNLSRLSKLVEEGVLEESSDVSPEVLVKAGISQKSELVKILGGGELSVSLNISAHAFSKSARSKIEAAGGTATEIKK